MHGWDLSSSLTVLSKNNPIKHQILGTQFLPNDGWELHAKKLVFWLKSIYSEDILPQWSRAQGFETILGSKFCWCQIPKSEKFRRTWKKTLDFDKSCRARGVRRVWSAQFLKVQGTAKFKIAPKRHRWCISAIACHGPLWTTHAFTITARIGLAWKRYLDRDVWAI